MKYIGILVTLFFVSFFSCSKPLCACDPYGPPYVKAVVIAENNADCSRPLIAIDVTDTAHIRSITGQSGDTFVASQLPPSLKLSGQKIYITPGTFATGEDFTCTTIGPAYPHLKIINAASR